MSRIAVYPGSFDPVTNGHVDIIRRACRLFGRVLVVVADNSAKIFTFKTQERIQMVRQSIRGLRGASVESFSGLIVDYLREKKATILIRGMRVVSDMDYEFQMASVNRKIFPAVETVFLMPDERYTYLSSSIIKEVTRMGADVGDYLPPSVKKMLLKKFSGARRLKRRRVRVRSSTTRSMIYTPRFSICPNVASRLRPSPTLLPSCRIMNCGWRSSAIHERAGLIESIMMFDKGACCDCLHHRQL